MVDAGWFGVLYVSRLFDKDMRLQSVWAKTRMLIIILNEMKRSNALLINEVLIHCIDKKKVLVSKANL